MPQYYNSTNVPGYSTWSNGNWSSFMNSYAATSFNTGATSGMRGASFSGSASFTAPASGTYTATAATDDSGTFNIGGTSFSTGGFGSSGTTGSKYYSKGSTVSFSWFVQNSGGGNGDDFDSNPCAIAFTIDGPELIKGCTDSRANNYNSSAEEDDGSCTYNPPTASISLNKSYIVNTGNQSATLTWSYGGVVDSVSTPTTSSPATVSPSSTTTYTITANGPKQSTSVSATLTVYQPPSITLSLGKSSIVSGQSTSLSWDVTGDTTTTTIDQGIGDVPNNGTTTISPTISTTYTGTTTFAAPGADTYSDTDTIRLVVYQPPTLDITLPSDVNYGEDVTLEYEYEYANISAKVTPQYKYRNANNDGFVNINGAAVNLTPLSTSAEFGVPGTLVADKSVVLSPVYNDDGPFEVTYTVEVEGDGGAETITQKVTINVDLSPDNLIIPGTQGEKDEEPVYTPDPDAFPNTILEIQDVDIPVEIKSNAPIKVSLDNGTTWLNVREKT